MFLSSQLCFFGESNAAGSNTGQAVTLSQEEKFNSLLSSVKYCQWCLDYDFLHAGLAIILRGFSGDEFVYQLFPPCDQQYVILDVLKEISGFYHNQLSDSYFDAQNQITLDGIDARYFQLDIVFESISVVQTEQIRNFLESDEVTAVVNDPLLGQENSNSIYAACFAFRSMAQMKIDLNKEEVQANDQVGYRL